MTLEKGDYFVVTRGPELHPCSMFGLDFFGIAQQRDDERPRYDRSHEGNVYQAMAVAGDVVAAKLVATNRPYRICADRIGAVESLNTGELEVITVGRDFVEALGVEAAS